MKVLAMIMILICSFLLFALHRASTRSKRLKQKAGKPTTSNTAAMPTRNSGVVTMGGIITEERLEKAASRHRPYLGSKGKGPLIWFGQDAADKAFNYYSDKQGPDYDKLP